MGKQRIPFLYFQREQHETQSRGNAHSWWRSALMGYFLALLMAFCAFLFPLTGKVLGPKGYLIEAPFVVVTLLVGWFWGLAPALLVLVLEVLALDYWIIPPEKTIGFFLWPELVFFTPFVFIQLLVLGLVTVQKRYRQELLERNAQLQEANEVRDRFLSLASHELKTPLTTIKGQTQLALRYLARQPLPAQWASLPARLAKIDEQTHRLQRLVDDLLHFSSLRSGKLPFYLTSCDFCQICLRVVEDQAAFTNRRGDLKTPPHPVLLRADDERLGPVVTNVVLNALHYSSEASTIEVQVSQEEASALLEVHNDGPGISPEHREHLFEPFYRTPEAYISLAQGWGLGLAISKEIVKQHGGRIWVEAKEEETTFKVALPLSSREHQE